jgi:predicted HAD superfamily hydrolase
MNERHPLFRAGREVAGPIFYAFVDWVLKQASLGSVDRLYFIARDGQVLYEIARRLAAARRLQVEIRYLYGSRQAWRLPALKTVDARGLDWAVKADPLLSVEIIARRLGLDADLLAGELGEETVDGEIEAGRGEAVAAALAGSESLRAWMLASATRERELAVSYLRQEGLFEAVSWAMVDLGWYGNLQDCLARILSSDGNQRPVTGFYFGLMRGGEGKHAYFFRDKDADDYLNWGRTFISHMEVLATADHGMTTGYRAVPGGVVPSLKEERNEAAFTWGLAELRGGISAYCSEALASGAGQEEGKSQLLEMIRSFYTKPPVEVAAAFGCFPFSSDQTETHYYPFAPSLSVTQAVRYLLNFGNTRRFKTTFWIHGSRVQSGLVVRWLLGTAAHIFWTIDSIRRSSKKGTP